MLRARKLRREPPAVAEPTAADDPEAELFLADSLGPALLVVLETLTPAERVAFVLHDVFGVPFEEIAAIVGRSEPATRQLASRARRRVKGIDSPPDADHERRERLVGAFLAASRSGDFEALLCVLAPDVVLRADETAVEVAAANKQAGAPELVREARGARAVAHTFTGRAQGARPALIDGAPGAVWSPGGSPRVAFVFTTDGDSITAIDLIMAPDRLAELDIELR
jgi:RNA polymerase sigma-70 factor (ECF subfamily)